MDYNNLTAIKFNESAMNISLDEENLKTLILQHISLNPTLRLNKYKVLYNSQKNVDINQQDILRQPQFQSNK